MDENQQSLVQNVVKSRLVQEIINRFSRGKPQAIRSYLIGFDWSILSRDIDTASRYLIRQITHIHPTPMLTDREELAVWLTIYNDNEYFQEYVDSLVNAAAMRINNTNAKTLNNDLSHILSRTRGTGLRLLVAHLVTQKLGLSYNNAQNPRSLSYVLCLAIIAQALKKSNPALLKALLTSDPFRQLDYNDQRIMSHQIEQLVNRLSSWTGWLRSLFG
jgi:hypothetical protein